MNFNKLHKQAYAEFVLKIVALMVTLYFLFAYSDKKDELNTGFAFTTIVVVTFLFALIYFLIQYKRKL